MQVQIKVEKWAVEKGDSGYKIVGDYKLFTGGTEIAKQAFNKDYNATTIIFPQALILEIEEINKKINDAITKNFTGGE